jgi:Kef-type K+ transport system membrane component KefB
MDLGLIVVLATVAGLAARALRQPPVVGEIIAGILAGPTLWHGSAATLLFSTEVRPFLSAFANLGIVLFMFLVGLELDRVMLRGAGRIAAGTTVGSTLLPFGVGCLLALYLIRQHPAGNRVGFVVFVGVAFAITAFPVLARIIADERLSRTRIGALALSAAAVCDVVAWGALALVQAAFDHNGRSAWWVLLAVPYVAAMFFGVRPLLARMLGTGTNARRRAVTFPVVLAGLLLSAAVTQLIGLHFIFGAFLFGLAMPRNGPLPHREILRRTQTATTLLLPVYFVVAGLNVDLSVVGPAGLAELVLIVVVAVAGKFLGALLGARTQGLSWRPAAMLGVLMNTRGLTELVVLGVGLQIGALDRGLYSLMVVMAVVTTAMAGPILRRLNHRAPVGSERRPAEPGAVK